MAVERRIGVLWDMDGTLVNTEPLWMQAEEELVGSFGGVWTQEQALQCVGQGLPTSARILQAAGVRLSEDEIIDWLTDHVTAHLDPAAMPWRPGAVELLRELHEAGVPNALVTMSYRRMAEAIAGQLGFAGFDAIVAGDEVAHEKPHPDPYLRGAAALGLDPADCVAFEDSVFGVASAVAAGTIAVAVPFLVEIPDAGDHHRWTSLDGRTAADVLALERIAA
ncbi:MAG TPA: HAD family phosphatase [Microbacteriaceae bacterium]|nr:HAD family phosphatase [Microbacteriaceae bacterium]